MGVYAHEQRAGKFECSFPLILFVSVLKCLPFFSFVARFKGIIKGKIRKKNQELYKKVQRFLSMPSVGRGREKRKKQ